MRFYEFADFRIDSEERVLYRDKVPIALAPKVFDTLFALVQRHGRVVSKDTLMEEIWQNTFVEENNLTQYIFTLRRVLGEKKDTAKFIETVSRRGYRFVPEVKIVEVNEEVSSPAFRRLADENFARSDLNRQPDKKLFENETQDSGSIEKETFDSRTKQSFAPENGNRNGLPKAKTENIAATLLPRPEFRARAVLIFGFVALLIIGSLGFALRFGWQSKLQNSAEIKLKHLTESGNLRGATISPDGNLLAYVLLEGKNFSLRLKNISTDSEFVVIAPTETQFGSPRFSPDGNFIYCIDRNGIFQIPVFGGEPRRISSNMWGNYSLSPDGKQIAFLRGNQQSEQGNPIIVAEIDGSGERVIATPTDPDFYVGSGLTPAWSPDGENLTLVAGRRSSKEIRLLEVNLQTGSQREVQTADVWQSIDFIRWASREELLVCGQRKGDVKTQIWSVKFPEGIAERVTNDFNDYLGFSISRDGSKIVAFTEIENVHLWLFDKETGAARQITSGASRSEGRFGLAFAPDNRIFFTARDKNDYDIFSVNADGGDVRRLTKNAGRRNTDAVVSPDNQFIVFVSDRAGEPRLWRMNLDGSGARRLTDLPDGKEQPEGSPYFSADGQWIYYVFWQSGKGSIRKIPSSGGQSIAVSQTDKNVYEPIPSPDGKFLAHAVYNDEIKPPQQVAVMSLENPTAPERFFNFPAVRLRVRWLSDSNSVVSAEDPTDGGNLWQTNLETGERKQITNFTTESVYRFDVSPDNRFYVFSRGEYFHDAVLIER